MVGKHIKIMVYAVMYMHSFRFINVDYRIFVCKSKCYNFHLVFTNQYRDNFSFVNQTSCLQL
ncbi:hypothetical protein EJ73_02068 [Hoylesella shahii DSM 15611 = JCM 12083]|uniref:Uncharacterized protein n=1 Tax=Hoylesella shahii DSM 15611 = JCM 12083 TaxID=1122991 RepID=A0A318I747_9BACT|nr:hypothetical protein EJ73_02068 [Hoylesella shahii DSM 15611 = JCM 12083]